MVLDLDLFRPEKEGYDSKKVRESQQKRYANVNLVDKVEQTDADWRKSRKFSFRPIKTLINR